MVNNMLAAYNVGLVTFTTMVGFTTMTGGRGKGVHQGGGYRLGNWEHAMAIEAMNMWQCSNAILGVLWAYTGWENANCVLSEVCRPRGNESNAYKAAAFLAIDLTTVLYELANVVYLAVLPSVRS